jgi:hypothetical protein
LLIAPADFRSRLAEEAARHTLEAIHQLRERHLRGIDDKQMDVIVGAAAFHEFGLEIAADLGEDCLEIADREGGERVTAEFGTTTK